MLQTRDAGPAQRSNARLGLRVPSSAASEQFALASRGAGIAVGVAGADCMLVAAFGSSGLPALLAIAVDVSCKSSAVCGNSSLPASTASVLEGMSITESSTASTTASGAGGVVLGAVVVQGNDVPFPTHFAAAS